MKLFNKFYALCGLAACSIFVFFWVLISNRYLYTVADAVGSRAGFKAAAEFEKRLVVFGDSWSDNNARENRVWTEWLCALFSCHHENLAQTAKSPEGDYIGSVVDNTELDLSDTVFEWPLADLKDQVSLWMEAELKATRGFSESEIRKRQNNTIVVVSFGIWDIWNLVEKDYYKATESVDRRIGVIIEQLNMIAEKWGTSEIKAILTLPVDVTFLPAFESTLERQKNVVQIIDYWGTSLREAATEWENGTIYLFDTNAFMVDLIRDWQLFAAGIVEANGLGKNEEPGWENVVDPCLEPGQGWSAGCKEPDKYLFWDDMHLGPSAHRLMGTEIFYGIEKLWLDPKPMEVEPSKRSETFTA